MFDYKIISEQQALGKTLALVTIIQTKGSTPREIGAKMLIAQDQFWGSIGGGKLELLVLEKARDLMESRKCEKMALALCSTANQCCGGFVELFIDIIQPQPQLYIFGAGHVGQAIFQVLEQTDFQMTAIDSRPEWCELISFSSIKILQEDGTDFSRNIPKDSPNIFAVVLTHSHSLDEDLIRILSQKNLAYLGLIGSETKWRRFQQRLAATGISAEQLSQVHCPMGIPLGGGKAPKEVAISIAAGLICELSKMRKESNLGSQKVRIDFEEEMLAQI